jgi:hypothetical protein
MVFPFAEGDKPEVGNMVGGKKVQEQISRAFPVIGQAKNLEKR